MPYPWVQPPKSGCRCVDGSSESYAWMTSTAGASINTFHGLSAGKMSHPLTFAPGPATPPGTPPTPPSVPVLPALLPLLPPLVPPDEPPDVPPLLPPDAPPELLAPPPPSLPFEWPLLPLLQPLENARATPVLSVSGQTAQWGLGFFLDMRGLPAKGSTRPHPRR